MTDARLPDDLGISGEDARLEELAGDPVTWQWPEVVEPLRTFDKYSGTTSSLSVGEKQWQFYCGGYRRSHSFAFGPAGVLQQKLAYFIQKDNGPASLNKFLKEVTESYPVIRALLMQGKRGLKECWKRSVLTPDTAIVARAVLLKAAAMSLGPWKVTDKDFLEALDGRNSVAKANQLARLSAREPMLPKITLAGVVSVLDEGALEEDWDPDDLEGLCALASMYQHGVRPVQLITLSAADVFAPQDSDENEVVVLSFEAAKQGEDVVVAPLPRTVRPEWARMFVRLLEMAEESGRERLFACTTTDRITYLAQRSCNVRGKMLEVLPGELRHTAAQTLADAGHDRDSLQRFMGHARKQSGRFYYDNTAQMGETLNHAIGASVLYGNLLDIADVKWISVAALDAAPEDEQIGAVIAGRLVAGIGRCERTQTKCKVDPVVSCYGCSKFLPVDELGVHLEAFDAMRAQVLEYANDGDGGDRLGLTQLEGPLARAQAHITYLRQERPSYE